MWYSFFGSLQERTYYDIQVCLFIYSLMLSITLRSVILQFHTVIFKNQFMQRTFIYSYFSVISHILVNQLQFYSSFTQFISKNSSSSVYLLSLSLIIIFDVAGMNARDETVEHFISSLGQYTSALQSSFVLLWRKIYIYMAFIFLYNYAIYLYVLQVYSVVI